MLKAIRYILAFGAVAAFIRADYLFDDFIHHRPTSPDLSAGLTSPIENHGGTWYVSVAEKHELTAYFWLAAVLGLVAFALAFFSRARPR